MGVGGPEPCCRRGKGFDVTLMNLRCVSRRERERLTAPWELSQRARPTAT